MQRFGVAWHLWITTMVVLATWSQYAIIRELHKTRVEIERVRSVYVYVDTEGRLEYVGPKSRDGT